VICREQDPHSPWEADDPLAVRHSWQDLIDQVCGSVRHSSGCARGAEASLFAGEGDEFFVWAVSAFDSHETSTQLPAAEKGLKLSLDETRIPKAMCTSLLGQAQAGLVMAFDNSIERRLLGFTALVGLLVLLGERLAWAPGWRL
jgi:hypothetical protein